MIDYNISTPTDYYIANVWESEGNPNYIKIANNTLFMFYRRYLFQKIISRFDWKIPAEWSPTFVKNTLIARGYIGIIDNDELGIIAQPGGLFGFNMYYQPAFFILNNPHIDPKYCGIYRVGNNRIPLPYDYSSYPERGRVDLLQLTPDYVGLLDIVGNFAAEMTLAHYSVDINLMQAKDPKTYIAPSKTAAAAFKKATDAAISGEPVIVYDKDIIGPDGQPTTIEYTKSLHDAYIGDKLLDALRTIENRFDAMIGLNNTNISKRANMTTTEVTANADEVQSLPEVWRGCLEESQKYIKSVYPDLELNIKVKEPADNAQSNIDDFRPL